MFIVRECVYIAGWFFNMSTRGIQSLRGANLKTTVIGGKVGLKDISPWRTMMWVTGMSSFTSGSTSPPWMWWPNARHRGGPCFLLLTLRWLGWTGGRLIFGVCHCTLETVAIQSAHPLLWARFDKGHGYTWLQSYGSGGILAIPWEGPKETGRNGSTTGLARSWHCSFCQVHKQHELINIGLSEKMALQNPIA